MSNYRWRFRISSRGKKEQDGFAVGVHHFDMSQETLVGHVQRNLLRVVFKLVVNINSEY